MAEPHGREQQPTTKELAGSARERSPRSGVPSKNYLLRVLVLQLALRDFLEGHGEVVLRPRLHQRWRRVLESDTFSELVVVVVDLAGSLGRDDHERVARVDVVQELIDAWMDHGRLMVPAVCNSLWTMAWSSSAARSTSSLTIT